MDKAVAYKKLMVEAFQGMKAILLDPRTSVDEVADELSSLADIVAHPAPEDAASQLLRTECRTMYRAIRSRIISSPNTSETFPEAAELCRDALGLLDVPYEER